MARQLGVKPMPHQQRVFDVAGELDPETRLPAYREIIVTMMRQNGKTVIVFSVEVDRCNLWTPRQRVLYTAQTGSDARKKLLQDQKPILEASPLWGTVTKVREAKGEEEIVFRNGSRIGLAARSESGGHSYTVNLGIIDEAWEDEDDRREQAIIPAMNTIPDAQLWICSTQGTEASTYLNRKTELGRAAASDDKGSGIAYFEWSIPPDADIENPEVWWTYMPALGWTIQPPVVAHALQSMVQNGEESEWRRAYGNQRTRGTADRVIPAAVWEVLQRPDAEVAREEAVAFGLHVHPERISAAICASDRQRVELVDFRAGTGWVRERVANLMDRYRGTVYIDNGGSARSLGDDLETQDGRTIGRLSGAEVAAACGRIYDAIADATVRFRQHEALDAAVAGLGRKPIGDRFVWSQSSSTADITPFMAATLAYDGAMRDEQGGDVLLYVA
jgi:hypothetical protein